MERQEIQSRVAKILAASRLPDISQWDSLKQVRVLTAVESEFAIRFTLKEIQAIGRLPDLLQLIESKLECKSLRP